jgi:predicted Rossmann fold flavoprotein
LNPRRSAFIRGQLLFRAIHSQHTLDRLPLQNMHDWDVIVIGGGAAGLFCAIEAGKRGRRVLVLEHNETAGKKIRISGGGRCNFTNLWTGPENFVSANPHFCKSALARYSPTDFIALVEKHGIAYHEKKLGQLFCDGSAQQIIDLLLRECQAVGATVRCGALVREVAKEQQTGAFNVATNEGNLVASSLVVATGGLSLPSLGATDFGYRIARQFGLQIETARPALVPLTLTAVLLKQFAKLSGVSLDAVVGCGAAEFRENILLTHRGLSGPAILQISTYWRPGVPVSIDLIPDQDVLGNLTRIVSGEAPETSSGIELVNFLASYLPRRFAEVWCELYVASRPLRQYHNRQLVEIAQKLNQLQIFPAGTEGFKKAEVTAGGVATTELSSQTMEAKRVPGLYFIGEVVDVTGQLGGYNFQWAWASGYAAGQVA